MAKKADSFSAYKNIMEHLKKGAYQPIYFLCGAEAYYIDKISNYAEEHILTEGEKGFNQTVLYGKDVTGSQLVSVCKRYPMMGNYQVVIVKEAQNMKELDYLSNYVDAPLSSTLLFLCWKSEKYDKRLKFFKSLQKYTFFESVPLYDNQIPKWIEQYTSENQLKISSRAAELMADYIGADLTIISNELEKIRINKKPGEEITEQDVELHTGISKEYNSFELQKHLAKKDFLKSYKVLKYMAGDSGKGSMPQVSASLYNFFSKIYLAHFEPVKSANAFQNNLGLNYYAAEDYLTAVRNYPIEKVQNIMKILMDYDLKGKGVDDSGTSTTEDLYKEMLYKIIH